jgi:hypothetical protein
MAELRGTSGVWFAGGASRKAGLFAALLIAFGGTALALDPAKPANSYMKRVFTKEDGLQADTINVVLQTRNGFLWIGTPNRLERFDGWHFHEVEFPPQTATSGIGRALAEAPDGALWAGTSQGLLRAVSHYSPAAASGLSMRKTGSPTRAYLPWPKMATTAFG